MTATPGGGRTGSITDPTTGRRTDVVEQQRRNVRASWTLLVSLSLVVVALGAAIGWAVDPAAVPAYAALAAGLACVQFVVAWQWSDKIALAVVGARKASLEEHRYLVNVTEAVAIGCGVPMPRLFVMDTPALNAFATGRDPTSSSIVVTKGLIEALDRQELEAVVAHELAHVRNYDVRFLTWLTVLVGSVAMMRDVVLRWMRFGGRGGSRRSSGPAGPRVAGLALVAVLVIVAPILATVIRFAAQRRREYLADATAAHVTKNPGALASALETIAARTTAKMDVPAAMEPMFFVGPSSHGQVGWFDTHPPIARRIDLLNRM